MIGDYGQNDEVAGDYEEEIEEEKFEEQSEQEEYEKEEDDDDDVERADYSLNVSSGKDRQIKVRRSSMNRYLIICTSACKRN